MNEPPNLLKKQLQDAIDILATARYEGDVIAFAGFYITPKGEVKNIICCDNSHLLALVGSAEMLKDLIKSSIQFQVQPTAKE